MPAGGVIPGTSEHAGLVDGEGPDIRAALVLQANHPAL